MIQRCVVFRFISIELQAFFSVRINFQYLSIRGRDADETKSGIIYETIICISAIFKAESIQYLCHDVPVICGRISCYRASIYTFISVLIWWGYYYYTF